MKTIAIVAGEVSGDYLAAGLIQSLKQRLSDVKFFGIAGKQMVKAGCDMLYSSENLTVMGLTEVFSQLHRILAIRRKFYQYCIDNPPDLFVGVDAPDFNLSLEKKLRQAGIKTIHYVSPSVWAWRTGRLHKIKQAVDHILTLFPFEAPLYQQYGIPVTYVGHPLADVIPMNPDRQAARKFLRLPARGKIIGILPGSRKTEVKKIGPIFCDAAVQCLAQQKDLIFAAPMVTSDIRRLFKDIATKHAQGVNIRLYDGEARKVMVASDVLMLASGTATLEALLCKRPMVVAYKLNTLTYWYVKHKASVNHYALPNHLADRNDIVLELNQHNAKADLVAAELIRLLTSPDEASELQRQFIGIHKTLRCDASHRAANAVIEVMAQ